MSFGQGGPSWGPGDNGTPDWAALADEAAARSRRKRWLLIGGGAVATAAVVAIVATAIVTTGGSKDGGDSKSASELPSPQTLPSDTAQPQPSFSSVAPPPPPNPHDFISSAKKDKAPLSADTLFPGKTLKMGDRTYTKGPTARTTNCASATLGSLGSALENNGCEQVIRATYVKDGVAVTIGVATFESEAKANQAKQQAGIGLAPLAGEGVPGFCDGGHSVCRNLSNSYGRYAYFSITGYTNGKSVTRGDKNAFAPGDDLSEFTFRQIVARGEAQASAAATAPAH
ncbi:hypothetical protein [Streptomyces sp. CBMA152]|uniref:hypothetical protein n=1 Tax=Streptomyces sp. CBMA152 TaxID=1896312 RepID=UPI0016613090|nr:hypothetical protein [Streptomyces sp. CBMA152]MBD0745580.1 hypothetical protein [Streptomyces sp. CBMA152]